MTDAVHDRNWLMTRLKRHLVEAWRLTVPVVATRLGIMSLGIVDTAMIGHYATQHLAWLNLAHQSVFMFSFVVGLGLVTGVAIFTANAEGAGDKRAAGQVWRKSLPYTLLISLVLMVICFFGEFWLGLLGQTPDNIKAATPILTVLALGIPGHLLFVHSTMFLESIHRAYTGVAIMLVANIVNIIVNYTLIYGAELPFVGTIDPMGALGTAWASTTVRWTIALLVLTYIWHARSLKDYHVRARPTERWADWAPQRRIGYANALSLAAEIAAFSGLAVFAGLIGTTALAAHGVIYQIIGVPLMIAIGIGTATSVRTGIAYGRGDRADTALAGSVGLFLGLMVTALFGIVILLFDRFLIGLFTDDQAVLLLMLPGVLVFVFGMVTDGLQMIANHFLRGLKESWWPTALQTFSFLGVMLPACYILALPMGWGLTGLMAGMAIGVTVSLILQAARLYWVLVKDSRWR